MKRNETNNNIVSQYPAQTRMKKNWNGIQKKNKEKIEKETACKGQRPNKLLWERRKKNPCESKAKNPVHLTLGNCTESRWKFLAIQLHYTKKERKKKTREWKKSVAVYREKGNKETNRKRKEQRKTETKS